ncbi:MAG: transpeptidase family protein [Deltaproteobacteria bacterium]|nr:transpeptidase family protein [Deltaproteobacteria bacterium]
MTRLEIPRFEPEPEAPELVRARARGRIAVLGALMMGCLAIAALRGVQLAVAPSDRTVRVAAVQRWDQVTLQARRGEILDRNGHRLATSVATPNIIVDPILVEPAEVDTLAAQVAGILDLPVAEIAEKLVRPSRYVRLAMRVHPAMAARIDAIDHPSLWVERTSRRYYPEETLASQLIGFVDTDGSGREGLESELDSWLRGGQILLQRKRDRRGLSVDQPLRNDLDLNVGMDVHLTIDRQIQRMTERALEDVFAKHAPKAAWAVVVDVRTGDILALANAPGFNPNAITEDPGARKNHVVQDAIEPGSVFKPFTVAAAIEEGLVTPESKIDCENGNWAVGRARIHDDHPHGVVTITEVIKYSSNIGSAKLALQLGARTFLGYVGAFGFGERTGVQLPGERTGVVRTADKIKPIELVTTAFGQGVTATPLQLAMATAALANDGIRMKPRLVTRVEDAHGVPEYNQRPEIANRVVSVETARQVAQMMVTVTEAGGTATRAVVPGYQVGGKTGTAQKAENGRYGAGRIGSFVGFIPADRPVLAIAVSVDEPSIGSKFGGIVAAPAFASIAGQSMRYLGIPADPPPPPDPTKPVPPAPVLVADVPDPDLVLGWNGQGWTLPDLAGRPLREVMAGVQGSGLNLQLEGTGLAVSQLPPAGASLAPGETLRVIFQ